MAGPGTDSRAQGWRRDLRLPGTGFAHWSLGEGTVTRVVLHRGSRPLQRLPRDTLTRDAVVALPSSSFSDCCSSCLVITIITINHDDHHHSRPSSVSL
jgi:hypothetical protein